MCIKERKQILIYGGFIILVGAFVYFRYLPLRRRLDNLEKAKASEIAALSGAKAETKYLSVFKKELKRLQNQVGDYDARIPSQRNLGGFIREIADLMSEHSLLEQLVEPGKEEQINGLYCIPVSMQCKGRLQQIFEFFKSLQELNRAARIVNVELDNDPQFTGEVNMKTKAFVYYKNQPEEKG